MPGEIEEETIFHKLGEIPVVNDGWTTAWEYYSKIKDYNALTRLSLGMAESSVKVAGKISTPVLTPVISRYQPQIDTVNDYACKKLDEIEDRYPLIKQPTNEVKEACTEYMEPVFDRVKPVVTQVQGMLDNSKRQVARIKTCGNNVVVGAKDFGVNTVSNVVHATLVTPPGRFVTGTIDGMLDSADFIVDKYLPEEKNETPGKVPEDSDSDDDSSKEKSQGCVEPMEKENPTPERVAVHLKCVSDKIRRRMYRLAVRDLRKAKLETYSALNKMTSTFQLVDYAKTNLTSARHKVEDMWVKMVKESESIGDNEKKSLFAGSIEDRIIMLGAIMAGQVKSGISLLEKSSSEFGSFARNPITKTKEYSEVIKSFSVVRSVQDFSSERLEQLAAYVTVIQRKCREMLDGMESPEWLNVEVKMDDMDLQDNDLTIEHVISSNNNSEDEMEREDNRRVESEGPSDQSMVDYENLD